MSETEPEARRAFFAACPLGVSELLAGELRELGIDVEREHPAGVAFAGRLADGWAAPIPGYVPYQDLAPANAIIDEAAKAAGRDPAEHGETAGEFDLAREDKQHLAFGHGVHFCMGAPLARLEAGIALHIWNNLFAFGLALGIGSIDETLHVTEVGWSNLPLSLTQNGLYVVLVLWLANRMGITSRTDRPVLLPTSASV